MYQKVSHVAFSSRFHPKSQALWTLSFFWTGGLWGHYVLQNMWAMGTLLFRITIYEIIKSSKLLYHKNDRHIFWLVFEIACIQLSGQVECTLKSYLLDKWMFMAQVAVIHIPTNMPGPDVILKWTDYCQLLQQPPKPNISDFFFQPTVFCRMYS